MRSQRVRVTGYRLRCAARGNQPLVSRTGSRQRGGGTRRQHLRVMPQAIDHALEELYLRGAIGKLLRKQTNAAGEDRSRVGTRSEIEVQHPIQATDEGAGAEVGRAHV